MLKCVLLSFASGKGWTEMSCRSAYAETVISLKAEGHVVSLSLVKSHYHPPNSSKRYFKMQLRATTKCVKHSSTTQVKHWSI